MKFICQINDFNIYLNDQEFFSDLVIEHLNPNIISARHDIQDIKDNGINWKLTKWPGDTKKKIEKLVKNLVFI